MKYAEKDVIAAIRSQFTDENAKKFLNAYWRKKRKECGIPQTGFCYVSSHAYFRLMDGKNIGLTIKTWAGPSDFTKGHFWVEKNTGERVDLTSEQYGNKFDKYAYGKTARIQSFKKILNFVALVEKNLKPLKKTYEPFVD